jgi:hypothetical protein
MPLNNDFYGVYKIIKVKTRDASTGNDPSTGSLKPYVIKTFNVKTNMEASPVFFMQGNPLTRVLNIGNISETYTVNSPILVPPSGQSINSLYDGRKLLTDLLYLQYGNNSNTPSATLPVISAAKIEITNTESFIDLTLESDGDPNNTLNVYNFAPGNNTNINLLGIGNGARVARNYDFFVSLGTINGQPFEFLIENVSLNIKLELKRSNFLGAYDSTQNYSGSGFVPSDGTPTGQNPFGNNNGNGSYPNIDVSYSGYQFPFISVGGIEASATGKAAVAIHDDGSGNLSGINFTVPSGNQQAYTTRSALIAALNVTGQQTGAFSGTTGIQAFKIFLGDPNNNISLIPTQFNFNNGIIKSKNYNFSADVMTFDFEVQAYYTTS